MTNLNDLILLSLTLLQDFETSPAALKLSKLDHGDRLSHHIPNLTPPVEEDQLESQEACASTFFFFLLCKISSSLRSSEHQSSLMLALLLILNQFLMVRPVPSTFSTNGSCLFWKKSHW